MTGWRLRVRHHTGYRYASDVHASYNEARLTPPNTDTQSVIEALVEVRPGASLAKYRDYWGTWVHSFDINRAHRELSVYGYSVVETGKPRSSPADPPSWSDLRSEAVQDAMVEYLGYTAYTGLDDEVRSVSDEFAGTGTPREAVEGVMDWIHGGMEYEKGSTTVTTTAPEALRARRGVCQDFAHLGLALVRSLGVPARYTSGYLHPSDDAVIGEKTPGDSHAWIETWLGEWTPFDPTSGDAVDSRHVVVAHGRDYGDVPPLKGVYHGATAETLAVNVELTRLA